MLGLDRAPALLNRAGEAPRPYRPECLSSGAGLRAAWPDRHARPSTALPVDKRAATSLIGQVGSTTGGLRAYPLKHFNALRDFYLDAAKRHLHVVLWWD